jgi:phytoene dehydrogenase-like protein
VKEKSVIIIGAGMAGLAAGCYARMNGYPATILELHDKPGGLCTAWSRQGYTIDACINWLVGSKPGSALYRIWEELDAVQAREFLYADEYMRYEAKDGRVFVLYSDLDRLERHLREIAPEDDKTIRAFCQGARSFLKMDMPLIWLCGLWVEPGGGLPPSAVSGRNAIRFLCAQDHKKFVTTLPEKT